MSVGDYMKTFLQHKEKLDEVERQGDSVTSAESYDGEFTKIRELSLSYKTDNVYPSAEAMKSCNVSKNRFKDIVPFDYTRVKLKTVRDGSTSDYINASYIRGAVGDQLYIAAQGPMPKTVNDFWQMLWENDVRVILMACREYEGDPPKLKCQRYWPNSTTEELSFGDIKVTMEKEEKTGYKEHLLRHMVAKVGDASRKIVQFHYTEWPDTSVPRSISGILNLIERLREVQPLNAKETPPVLFHCSAGCGRTGTLIVIDFFMSLLKYGKLTKDFKLYDVIVEQRRQRMAIVQSLEQYVFVHDVIAVLFKRQLELISSSVYENIDARTAKSKEQETQKNIEPVKQNSLNQRPKPPIFSRKPSQTNDANEKTKAASPTKSPEVVYEIVKAVAQFPAPAPRKPCTDEAKSRMTARVNPTKVVANERSCDQPKEKPPKYPVQMIPVVYEPIPQEESPDTKKISSVPKPSNILVNDEYEEVGPERLDRRPKQDEVGQIKSTQVQITYKGINISYPNRFSKKPRGQRLFVGASGATKA